MKISDLVRFTAAAITAHRLRTLLTITGIAIGIASVVLLTSIGEGIHRFVLAEFTQFGTNIISINPGQVSTGGSSIGIFGTDQPLTIDDAAALARVQRIKAIVPLVQGNAEIKFSNKQRRTTVYGVGPDFPETLSFVLALGQFLPEDDPDSPRAQAVLGSKLQTELFGHHNPLGQLIRVAGDRYRVIGTMAPRGQVLGFDLDDTVYIPAHRAMQMFNRDSLHEIDILYQEAVPENEIVQEIKRIMIARHGKEDFTITTQQQMIEVLGSVLNVLTFAVGLLGGISLLVGGVGIMTIMTMAVKERTAETGLLRALGATRQQVQIIFLGEAVSLALIGGIAGLIIGTGLAQLLHFAVPDMPVHTPLQYIVIAELIAITTGLLAGVLPARHAAKLNPVEALRSE